MQTGGQGHSTRSTPQLPTHTQKLSKTLVFSLFDSIITDGPTNRRTYGRTEPLIELLVRN